MSYEAKDFTTANNACISQALSIMVQLKSPVKDLKAKNIELVQRLQVALYYGNEVNARMVKAERSELKLAEAESKFEKAKTITD